MVEGLAVLQILSLIIFFKRAIKPMRIISCGMDLLREQDFSSRLRNVGQAEADRIINIFNRMMEQLKNERLRLREQNHFLDLLINASPLGVIVLDFDGRIVSVNPAAKQLLGLRATDRVEGLRIDEIHHPVIPEISATKPGTAATFRLGNAHIYKCVHSAFADKGFYRSFYLLELLTEEVRRAEAKAYEKVIRMIAHEVNNTTAALASTLDTIAADIHEKDKDAGDALNMAIERCYGMNKFISAFADVVRIPEPQLHNDDLNRLANDCRQFMETACASRNIRINMQLANEPLPVRTDALLFQQVLVNIVKNSAEAIGNNGEIWICTEGRPACIEIIDNGHGIDRETEGKLFTPFFSTKPHGQGLGLIFVRETLERHGYSFSLRTGDDGLTRFRIILQ
jgi:nitrogen fixation/metabolism regulation signal transduction histidine kinase